MEEKKYKVTFKKCYCDVRCTPMYNQPCTIFSCMECKDRVGWIEDETETYSLKDYIELLKRGNVFITKVEEI